jgi:hypothetical protein
MQHNFIGIVNVKKKVVLTHSIKNKYVQINVYIGKNYES